MVAKFASGAVGPHLRGAVTLAVIDGALAAAAAGDPIAASVLDAANVGLAAWALPPVADGALSCSASWCTR